MKLGNSVSQARSSQMYSSWVGRTQLLPTTTVRGASSPSSGVIQHHRTRISHVALFHTASSNRVTKLLQVGHTVKVHEGPCHH